MGSKKKEAESLLLVSYFTGGCRRVVQDQVGLTYICRETYMSWSEGWRSLVFVAAGRCCLYALYTCRSLAILSSYYLEAMV